MGGADSRFEEAVTSELRHRGWTAVPQVGLSKFRIDLRIVHSDGPGDFLAGAECDGASYHSAATARAATRSEPRSLRASAGVSYASGRR